MIAREIFGMDLKTLRKDIENSGLTQDQLGEIIGKGQSSISRYLSDERNISIKVLETICKTLGVHPCKYFLENNIWKILATILSTLK